MSATAATLADAAGVCHVAVHLYGDDDRVHTIQVPKADLDRAVAHIEALSEVNRQAVRHGIQEYLRHNLTAEALEADAGMRADVVALFGLAVHQGRRATVTTGIRAIGLLVDGAMLPPNQCYPVH